MNEHYQQLEKQLWKLPESFSLSFEPPRSCTLMLGEFCVYVDYHKRKGLKLCSSVFKFPDGVPDVAILTFLKAWSKRKTEGGGKLEWGGHDEVLYIQEYPRNIIDDDCLSQLDQAFTSFRESLVSIQKKMAMIQRKSRSAADPSNSDKGTADENDDFLEQAMLESEKSGRLRHSRLESNGEQNESQLPLVGAKCEPVLEHVCTDQPIRKNRWQLKGHSFEAKAERTSSNDEDASACSNDQDTERNFLGFARRKKKHEPFVVLEDDYFSDDGCASGDIGDNRPFR